MHFIKSISLSEIFPLFFLYSSNGALYGNSPEQSELLKRLLLEMNDDQHMPPKNKAQLTPDELALFQWWIGKGASFDKKVHEIGMDSLMNIHLNKIRESYNVKKKPNLIQRTPVSAADPRIIRLLEEDGWVISPVSSGENHLRVTGFNIHDTVNIALKKLLQISEQMVELKLSGSGVIEATGRLDKLSVKISGSGKADMPSLEVGDPDLIIRTGGECRLSNFLLYGAAYAELSFTERLWPDFEADDLFEAIASYQKRDRRFGQVCVHPADRIPNDAVRTGVTTRA